MKYAILRENKKMINKKIAVYQIQALIDLPGGAKAGALGGWVEHEDNLDQNGGCWIDSDSIVRGNSFISGEAQIKASEIKGDSLVWSKTYQIILRCELESSHVYLGQRTKLRNRMSNCFLINSSVVCGLNQGTVEEVKLTNSSVIADGLLLRHVTIENHDLLANIIKLDGAKDDPNESGIQRTFAGPNKDKAQAIEDEFLNALRIVKDKINAKNSASLITKATIGKQKQKPIKINVDLNF